MLARATGADVDEDAKSFRLLDYKGRRANPRPHDVPLIPAAMEALEAMRTPQAGPYLFTVTGGETAATNSTVRDARSEEHTSELQSLMRISYAVFCLKKNKKNQQTHKPAKY